MAYQTLQSGGIGYTYKEITPQKEIYHEWDTFKRYLEVRWNLKGVLAEAQ